MKLRLRAEFHDGHAEEVTVSPLAIIGWEKWSGRRMSSMASDEGGIGMSDMVWMAWEQTRLQQGTTDEYETWAALLADLEAVDETTPTSGDEGA